ncbi:MAG: hypothetical protein K2Q09_05335 [Phycisphaerales bacterium]|nr:hypothetical protein [Phycisphaerales bacterium]
MQRLYVFAVLCGLWASFVAVATHCVLQAHVFRVCVAASEEMVFGTVAAAPAGLEGRLYRYLQADGWIVQGCIEARAGLKNLIAGGTALAPRFSSGVGDAAALLLFAVAWFLVCLRMTSVRMGGKPRAVALAACVAGPVVLCALVWSAAAPRTTAGLMSVGRVALPTGYVLMLTGACVLLALPAVVAPVRAAVRRERNGVCAVCGYPPSPSAVCPECGTPAARRPAPAASAVSRRKLVILGAFVPAYLALSSQLSGWPLEMPDWGRTYNAFIESARRWLLLGGYRGVRIISGPMTFVRWSSGGRNLSLLHVGAEAVGGVLGWRGGSDSERWLGPRRVLLLIDRDQPGRWCLGFDFDIPAQARAELVNRLRALSGPDAARVPFGQPEDRSLWSENLGEIGYGSPLAVGPKGDISDVSGGPLAPAEAQAAPGAPLKAVNTPAASLEVRAARTLLDALGDCGFTVRRTERHN